jgi:hypothetical protein
MLLKSDNQFILVFKRKVTLLTFDLHKYHLQKKELLYFGLCLSDELAGLAGFNCRISRVLSLTRWRQHVVVNRFYGDH